jgi:predicted ATP-grasp superfamily ATP-dependent carboligase
VREKAGAGAIGSFKIKTRQDLENWLNVNPEDATLIASTFLPGRNYACKMLFKNDELVMSATAERIDYLLANAAPSGISGMCARGQLLNYYDLSDRAQKALETVHKKFNKPLHGMFTVDFKEDKNGVPFITEINIRHVSFTHAFSLAGANFSSKTLDVFYNNKPFTTEHFQFDKKYHFIRGVDSELFILEDKNVIGLGKQKFK